MVAVTGRSCRAWIPGAMEAAVRPYEERDWPAVWAIVAEVVRAGDTFTYDPAMSEADARATWLVAPPGLVVVAVDGERGVGTAHMQTNRPGPGSHVATASF